MSTTHNVTLETADGNVTAHDHVLMAASPVLEAMLQSAMKLGSCMSHAVYFAESLKLD